MKSSEENKPLWEAAIFGKQVDEFLSSDIGKYLLEKAEKQYFNAILKLRDCAPEDLLKHQSEMKRAESIRSWLADAVEEGLRAFNLIEENDS